MECGHGSSPKWSMDSVLKKACLILSWILLYLARNPVFIEGEIHPCAANYELQIKLQWAFNVGYIICWLSGVRMSFSLKKNEGWEQSKITMDEKKLGSQKKWHTNPIWVSKMQIYIFYYMLFHIKYSYNRKSMENKNCI